MYDLTVIIPTFNEKSNIYNIVMAVDAVFHEHSLNGQILVVDDNSSDGTISIVNDLKRTKQNVEILVREHDHGLSQSVADGFSHASSDIFIVIDADFSHPPVLIPRMYDEIRKENDIVIGSRYMAGGGIRKWPLKRRVISIGATFLGRLLFPDITDPVSGFFAVRKSVVENAPLKPRGYKILLEVLGKGTWQKDKEIPFEFVDREIGSSKLKIRTIIRVYPAGCGYYAVLIFPSPQCCMAGMEADLQVWDCRALRDPGKSGDSLSPCLLLQSG